MLGSNRAHHVSAQDVTMATKLSSYDEVPAPKQHHRGSTQSENILHNESADPDLLLHHQESTRMDIHHQESTRVDPGCHDDMDTFSLTSSIYSGMGKHSLTISRNLNNYASTLPKGPVQVRNRPNKEILVPDWLITNHVT